MTNTATQSPEELYKRLSKNKAQCLMFFIDSIPASHSLFQYSHVTQIQTFMARQKKLESNLFWGTLIGVLVMEKSLYARNLIYRLTFYRSLSLTLIKYFIFPSFLSSYVVFRNNVRFKPVLSNITQEYDLEEERFRKTFEEFVSGKPDGFRRLLELRFGDEPNKRNATDRTSGIRTNPDA